MSRKYFGTDGIRGVANQKLTPELAFQLGRAAGQWMIRQNLSQKVVVGRDTRRSGPMLGAALSAGFCSVGLDVTVLGIAPTPVVVYAARTGTFGLGIIVSASHNPAPDNGIKLVGHDGRKLNDEAELEIEGLIDEAQTERPIGADVGFLNLSRLSIEDYLDFLEEIVPERLSGMHVAVDAANGAAYELAPAILARLGAKVSLSGVSPDGMNINADGGATKPEAIQQFTKDCKAEIGVAFDGDADRAVFSDEKGRLINGDRTIGLWAKHHRVEPRTVVGTVMSNGGFEKHLGANGFQLVRTPVGDKYVAQSIAETGSKIGGEQSGHIIFPDRQPTGDGLVTMLEVLKVLKQGAEKSSQFVDAYEPWPQVLINVEVADRETWNLPQPVIDAIGSAERALGERGRLNVRASGTQPMIRIMVEADQCELRDVVADQVLQALETHSGAKVYSRVDLTHALGD